MADKRRKTLLERFKAELKFYQLVLQDPRTPKLTKFFLGLAVGYALSPIDIIPDFIPVMGYLDDLIIIPTLIFIAIKLTPKKLLGEIRYAEFLKSTSHIIKGIERHKKLFVVKLAGAIDLNTMPPVENVIKEHEDHLDRDIVLDFQAVTHIDTSTLAVLIYMTNKLKQKKRRLGVINCNKSLTDYIKLNDLESVIHVYDSLNDAFAKAH